MLRRDVQVPDPERPEARTCNQCPYNAICTESWTARQVRGGLT